MTWFCVLVACAAMTHGVANADEISATNPSVIEWGFTATNAVTVGPAILFPSAIQIDGGEGSIVDVDVVLNGGSHTYAADLEIHLRSPSGTVVFLMDDAGGSNNVIGDLGFDDQADAPIPVEAGTDHYEGNYQPSVYGLMPVMSTAPAADGNHLSLFNGEDPNGQWELYVYDDALIDNGQFTGGWTITITTIPAPALAPVLGLGGLALACRRR